MHTGRTVWILLPIVVFVYALVHIYSPRVLATWNALRYFDPHRPDVAHLPVGKRTLTVEDAYLTDLWFPTTPVYRRACMVVVHGLTPDGRNDPRLQQLARWIAWLGVAVYVPHVQELAEFRLDPAVLQRLRRIYALADRACDAWILLGISVGAGPALRAVWTSPHRHHLVGIVLVGAYADACRLVMLGRLGWREPGGAPTAVWDRLQAAIREWGERHGWPPSRIADTVRALQQASGEAAIRKWCATVPADLRDFLHTLSPARDVPDRWPTPIWILHSPDDPFIPVHEGRHLFESLRHLQTQWIPLPTFRHVESVRRLSWHTRWKLFWTTWLIFQRLL